MFKYKFPWALGINIALEKKKIILFILSMFTGAVSTGAYAVWDTIDNPFNDPTIIIGDDARLVVLPDSSLTPEGLMLVPYGAFKGANDVDEYIYAYTVLFNKQGLIHIEVRNILLNEMSTDLLTIEIYTEELEENSALMKTLTLAPPLIRNDSGYYEMIVYVRITAKQPTSLESSLALRHGHITFDLYFDAVEPEMTQ